MQSKRVLIVDDNRDSALMLSMLLESEGYSVQTAHAGSEALGLFPEFQPEIALLDINLPDLDGFELARKVKDLTLSGDLLLIAISGYGQQENAERSASAGFDHYLVKPVDFELLLKLLKSRT